VPVTWSEAENIVWKVALPGEGFSSPVILGNQIWMTTALNEGKSLRAICCDRQSGKLLHEIELFTLEKTPEKHATNSYASPTPVIEPGRVYVHFGPYGTACLDTSNGKALWKNSDLHFDPEVGPGSSPMLFDNLLVVNCDGIDERHVVALDKQSGKIAWKTERTGVPNSTPSARKAFSTPLVIRVNGREQAVSPAADRVIAYNPKTGDEDWLVRYPGFSNVPRPIFGNDLVYVCTGYMTPQLWAIRPNGRGDVTDTHVAWKVTKQVPAKPSPLLVGKELYMVSDAGIATCLDALTGEEVWKERLNGNYTASPVFVDGHIYLLDEKGKTTVINPGRKFDLVAANELDSGFKASPAIAGKAFYLRTTSHLYRIEKAGK
jgi:outer membrane protein assembly factor BamB